VLTDAGAAAVLAQAAHPPVLADAATAAVLATVAPPPVLLAEAVKRPLPPQSLQNLRSRPCSHLPPFAVFFAGAALFFALSSAAAALAAAFAAAFAAAAASLSSAAFTTTASIDACVAACLWNASPRAVQKDVSHATRPPPLSAGAPGGNLFTTCP